ncbi:hypothetical protein [Mesorhizobium salmacidum]|uniref:Uncharacterized protein n=1 Tax=Mesorhizobium salmacidum TaxID=3015171 RepID=A0ABU8L0K7_9HYPH
MRGLTAFFAAVCIFTWLGPAAAGDGHTYRPYKLTKNEQKIVKFAVAMQLKDPGSPVFGNMGASISDVGVVQVCGTVNAKNGYGAYTGLAPYLGVLVTSGAGNRVFAVNAIGDGGENSAVAVITICQMRGIGQF